MPLRTRPEFVEAMTADLRAARTDEGFLAAARALPGRFMRTGVYKNAHVRLCDAGAPECAPDAPCRNSGGPGVAKELVVALEEASYSAQAGMQMTLSGGVMTVRSFVHSFDRSCVRSIDRLRFLGSR